MTERLADAKFKRIKEYYSAMGGLDPDIQEDMRWLINRIEELEKVIGDLDENVAAFETLWLEEKRKNKRYKQALEFYADEKNHEREWDTFTDSGVEKSEVMKDGGEKARQALKEKGV